MSADRGGPQSSGRDIFYPDSTRAPSLNPNQNSNQNSQSSAANTTPAMASTGESAQAALPPPPPLSRQPILYGSDSSSRPLQRDARDGASLSARHVPQLPRLSLFAPSEPLQRTDIPSTNRNSAPDLGQPTMSRSNPSLTSGMDSPFSHSIRRVAQHSDYDSGDDLDSPMDEEQALRYMEEFAATSPQLRAMSEDHVRATQLLRGQLGNKRVASKKALAQLQSVDMDTLPESERSESCCLLQYFHPASHADHSAFL